MLRRFRLRLPQGRWALGVTLALLVVGGSVAAGAGAGTDHDAGGAGVSAPSPAASPSTPDPGDLDAETLAEQFGIPSGATEAESLRIKLSFDMVTIPAAQREQLISLPGVTVVAPVTLGDRVIAAVPRDESDVVRASIPDAVIEPNQPITLDGDQTPVPSWGLDAVDNAEAAQDDHYFYDSTGAGTTVFVIDSGVQSDNPDFGGRVDVAAGKTFINDDRGTEDCLWHGTHVAGTVGGTTYGIAKQTRIVPVRVFGCTKTGSAADFFYALRWIVDTYTADRMVINMSLGTPTWSYLNAVSNYAVSRGFVVVAAAGNDNKDACTQSPASAANVITVGAFGPQNTFSSFSNWGKCVKVLAPGEDIVSDSLNSRTAIGRGTSMSSPHVAGLAARMLELHPTWKNADVLAALQSPDAVGHIANVPSGTPNLVAAIPMSPKVTALETTADPEGFALSWSTNGVGTFTSFSITVTDTTSGRDYPVVVSATRSSTVFTDVVAGHAYTVSITGTATMPSGAVVTTDPLTATGP